jgi:hypothetical protein
MAPEVWDLKTAKNSKFPKKCFEPVGIGGWPLISIWIKENGIFEVRTGQYMNGAHSHLQGLKRMINCWSPSERILFRESSERRRNISIILNKIVIKSC